METIIALLLAMSALAPSAATEVAACPTQWEAVKSVTTVHEDDSATVRLTLKCVIRHDER